MWERKNIVQSLLSALFLKSEKRNCVLDGNNVTHRTSQLHKNKRKKNQRMPNNSIVAGLAPSQTWVNHCTWFLCLITVTWWCVTRNNWSPPFILKNNIHSIRLNCIQTAFSSGTFFWLDRRNLWVRGEWNIVMKNIILAKKKETTTTKAAKTTHSQMKNHFIFDVSFNVAAVSIAVAFVYFLFRFFRLLFCLSRAWLGRIHTRWNFQDSDRSICLAWHLRFTLMEYNYCKRLYILFVYDCLYRPTPHTHTHNEQYVQIILNNKQ